MRGREEGNYYIIQDHVVIARSEAQRRWGENRWCRVGLDLRSMCKTCSRFFCSRSYTCSYSKILDLLQLQPMLELSDLLSQTVFLQIIAKLKIR